jgi:hypothetical protein
MFLTFDCICAPPCLLSESGFGLLGIWFIKTSRWRLASPYILESAKGRRLAPYLCITCPNVPL